MQARIALCVFGFALQGCTVYRFSPARQSLAMPRYGVLRVTRTDNSSVDLRPPVEVVADTIFGWVRPVGSEGLCGPGPGDLLERDWNRTILTGAGRTLARVSVHSSSRRPLVSAMGHMIARPSAPYSMM